MLIVELRGNSIPLRELRACESAWYGGQANQLSRERTAFPRIEGIHQATKLSQPLPHGVMTCCLTMSASHDLPIART